MKKLLLLLILATFLSCSSSDDNSNDNTNSNTDNKIDLPTWLKGQYKADHIFPQYPYPVSNPYSLNFNNNDDIIIKATANSKEISLKAFIEEKKAANQLVSVEEKYQSPGQTASGQTSYSIIIYFKNPDSSETYPTNIIYEISPRANTGNLNISYTYHGSSLETSVNYIKQ